LRNTENTAKFSTKKEKLSIQSFSNNSKQNKTPKYGSDKGKTPPLQLRADDGGTVKYVNCAPDTLLLYRAQRAREQREARTDEPKTTTCPATLALFCKKQQKEGRIFGGFAFFTYLCTLL